MISFGFQLPEKQVVELTFDYGDDKNYALERALREINAVAFIKTTNKHWIHPGDPMVVNTKQKVYLIKRMMYIILGIYPLQLAKLPTFDDNTKLTSLKEIVYLD